MDPVDVSRLLYLVDALQASPMQGRQLINIARQGTASISYRSALSDLEQVADEPEKLQEASQVLKRSLR